MAIAPAVAPITTFPTRRTTSAPAISARAVGHVYQGRAGFVTALDTVSLDARMGELVAIVGPSGCGKSTFLRILAGLQAPTSGTVELASQTPPSARRALGFGWLAQDDGLLPWRTLAANVSLALEVREGRTDPDRVQQVLERVGLAGSARQYPHELSGGMRQRAALARALVTGPRFLFLDEPFASLDELTRERLGDLVLEQWADVDAACLLVTHSVPEAVRLADRILVMSPSPGRLVADLQCDLPRPRSFDQPGFGRTVERIKRLLLGQPVESDLLQVAAW